MKLTAAEMTIVLASMTLARMSSSLEPGTMFNRLERKILAEMADKHPAVYRAWLQTGITPGILTQP